MARSLVFSNGRLHVGLDEHGLVHDLYFPYVGLENHISPRSLAHKVGIYVNGNLSWLDDGSWVCVAKYHARAMVGETLATNEKLGIRVEFTDAVATDDDIFLRSIHIINMRSEPQEVKLFCHQAFMISESATSDSAQYRPDLSGIVHYKGQRVFVASLRGATGTYDDYSVGKYSEDGASGTFMDAMDGRLEKNIVENGHTDSVLGMSCTVSPYESVRCTYSLIAAETMSAAEAISEALSLNGAVHYLSQTAAYWSEWLEKAALPVERLSADHLSALEQSLFVMKAHMDEHGAVLASLDSSLRHHPQDDTYNFCWPRDAAYTLWPLLRLGYTEETRQFFRFCVQVMHDEGYLSHKYRADGSLGSTWLPYVQPDGTVQEPLQTDETALVLFLVGQYFRLTGDQSLLTEFYENLIEPMANFLSGHISNGLLEPSYDLWEHSYGTHTYTTAVAYAALLEAADLADEYGRESEKKRWQDAATDLQVHAPRFFNDTTGYFAKSIAYDGTMDATIDLSSLYGAYMFGLYAPDSIEVERAFDTLREHLQFGDLYARFEGDGYYATGHTPNVWGMISLWVAQIALEREDSATAEQILEAVLKHRSPSGMISEQVTPEGQLASVCPLVWSHAELVSTLIDYVQTRQD